MQRSVHRIAEVRRTYRCIADLAETSPAMSERMRRESDAAMMPATKVTNVSVSETMAETMATKMTTAKMTAAEVTTEMTAAAMTAPTMPAATTVTAASRQRRSR
jgi:hypothetical protein